MHKKRTPANSMQVGGTHYSSPFQHWDLAVATGNRYLESQVSRYVTRWRKKEGIKDLEKASHFLDKTVECAINHDIPPCAVAVSRATFQRYAAANALDEDQLAIVAGVHTWTSVERLMVVHVRLLAYLEAMRTASINPTATDPASPTGTPPPGAAGPGYVGQ